MDCTTSCTRIIPLPNGGYRLHLSDAISGSMIGPNQDIILVLPEHGAALSEPSPHFILEDHFIALTLEHEFDDIHLSATVYAALRPLDSILHRWGIGLDADHAALRSRPLTADEVPEAIPAFHAAVQALFALLPPNAVADPATPRRAAG